MNADLLDGINSTSLQRRVTGTCAPGNAVRAIAANGAVTCDDEQVEVQQTFTAINSTPGSPELGFGTAGCPAGYAVVGGGYFAGTGTSPAPAIAEYASAVSKYDPVTGQRTDAYYVKLRNPDGTPYAGGGTVLAQCVYGFSYDQPTSSGAQVPAAVLHYRPQRSSHVVRHGQ